MVVVGRGRKRRLAANYCNSLGKVREQPKEVAEGTDTNRDPGGRGVIVVRTKGQGDVDNRRLAGMGVPSTLERGW